MYATLLGISIWTSVIGFVVVVVYLAVLLSLGWESHQKYGTGYYWVGGCLVGAIFDYFNYRYWENLKIAGDTSYPLWAFLITAFILPFMGLWAYLIYFALMQRLEKRYRAGTRLERRVFAAEQAATGTGRFREHLKGWEGDMQLDALIVESKFDEAEDYLEGIILATSQERDTNKARHYEQYRKVIMTERLFHDQSRAFQGTDDKKEPQAGKISSGDVDLRHPNAEVKQEDLPEGWKLSE